MAKELPILTIVDASIAVTGAFIAARNTARLLKDVARVILVLPEGSSIPAGELQDFWKVVQIPMVSLSKNLHSVLNYLPALIAGAWQLEKLMWRDHCARLQFNDFYLMHGLLMRALGFRGTIASWVRCHPTRFAGPLAKPMLWLGRQSANHVVAVSNAIRALLPEHADTAVLYDGYDGKVRVQRLWQTTDEKLFVYVGNYIRGKGQDIAIEAFARIAGKDATLKLAFHGGDMGLSKNKDYRATLEQAVARHGLQARVVFYGFAADTFAVLENAYAALNFSHAESFSMTVLEASGAGVAVIATASGGPQEIIKDGISGYVIPVGDVAVAAERMLLLARQPEKTLAMGEAGARHVGAHFSMEKLCAQLQQLWKLN